MDIPYFDRSTGVVQVPISATTAKTYKPTKVEFIHAIKNGRFGIAKTLFEIKDLKGRSYITKKLSLIDLAEISNCVSLRFMKNLSKNGAKFGQLDSGKNCILHYSLSIESKLSEEKIQFLLRKIKDPNPNLLHCALENKSPIAFKVLLAHGLLDSLALKKIDYEGRTILHHYVKVVSEVHDENILAQAKTHILFLLTHGSDIAATFHNGIGVLDLAGENIELKKFLANLMLNPGISSSKFPV